MMLHEKSSEEALLRADLLVCTCRTFVEDATKQLCAVAKALS